jgi:hypothetical protein
MIHRLSASFSHIRRKNVEASGQGQGSNQHVAPTHFLKLFTEEIFLRKFAKRKIVQIARSMQMQINRSMWLKIKM